MKPSTQFISVMKDYFKNVSDDVSFIKGPDGGMDPSERGQVFIAGGQELKVDVKTDKLNEDSEQSADYRDELTEEGRSLSPTGRSSPSKRAIGKRRSSRRSS